MRLPWRPALAGVLAAGVGLGVAELVSGTISGAASPVVAVGDTVIDHVPAGIREFAIDTFGTNDKAALITGTVVIVILLGAMAGLVAAKHRRAGLAIVGVVGLLGLLAAVTHRSASGTDAIPAIFGTIAAALTLGVLVDAAVTPPPPTRAVAGGFDRRRFLVSGLGAAVVAIGTGALGRVLENADSVRRAREAIRLPAPTGPAPAAVPADPDFAVPGLSPFLTPASDFYRVDTALVVPQVSPDSWRLRVHGMVDHPIELTYDELLARPMIERDVTLVCVSNEVGGNLAGTATFLGASYADLLREAGVQSGATQIVSRSVDGFTVGTPTAVVLDGRDAMIAVGMNGQPLPTSHGFPARLIVPGLYGYVSATKWVTDIELTTLDAYDAYWVERGWAKEAPIKAESRIDVPRSGSTIAGGTVAVAGVAWAPHVGVSKVEVQVDDGPWQVAKLGPGPTDDTWRQWVVSWAATAGDHQLTVRATDANGVLQTPEYADPVPDGATGWHRIDVAVRG